MSFATADRRRIRRGSVALLSLTATMLAMLWAGSGASAAELLYWNNYSAEPSTISFSNIDGSGGGPLNLSGVKIEGSEGMAIDSATNRLFVAGIGKKESKGQIVAVNLDGSGASVFTAPGAPVDGPEGLAIDPVTRTVFWLNTYPKPDNIAFAKLDGSAGGVLNTAGAKLDGAYRLAVDPVGGRVYWNEVEEAPASIGYAAINNSGGANLNLTGATPPQDISGLAVDSVAGRIYWVDNSGPEERISYASLAGGGGGDVNGSGGVFKEAYGLAIDPALGRLYWGNYANETNPASAIGFLNLAGGGGAYSISSAPVNGPQDPNILKSPAGTAVPVVSKDPKARSQLTCSQGTWAADFAGGFVYQAPRTLAYQWTRNGAAVATATASAFNATSAGSYACQVTAANQAGTASQTSAAVNVKAAKVKLSTKKKAKVKAGGSRPSRSRPPTRAISSRRTPRSASRSRRRPEKP